MFYPLNALTSPGVDDQQHFVPPLSPLFGASTTTGAGGATMAAMAAAMQLSNNMISPFYQPLGHLAPALFMPSLFGAANSMALMQQLIRATGSVPAQHRKLFIGGLNHETTDEQLREYYSQWGQVVDCIVIRDPVTRHSRGFGFVTFANTEMADAAMADRPHTIAGKIVDPKRAIPREQMLQASNYPPAFLDTEPPSDCKLLLSGLTNHTVDILRLYFERFGELEQVEIVGHSGFGFIVFELRSGVTNCLAQGKWHVINGRKVQVQEADRESSSEENAAGSLSPPLRRHTSFPKRTPHHKQPPAPQSKQ